jgi:PIN domain nuclease of toxin-antitoxin system
LILLDTHIWLWWLLGDGSLSSGEREALDRYAQQGKLSISWITIWETEMLERKGRVLLEPDFTTWIRQASSPGIAAILAVDLDVILAQRSLPDSFHSDPADRLIAATSLLSGYPLFTHNKRIIDSGACPVWSPNA